MNWKQLFPGFPSTTFVLASLLEQKAPKPKALQYGWMLRKAGGSLPVDTFAELAKQAGYPDYNLEVRYLRKNSHLFSQKQGVICFAVPAVDALIRQARRFAEVGCVQQCWQWCLRLEAEDFTFRI